MLTASMQLHREFFAAHTPGQKLFLQLVLAPEWASARHRPDLSIVFVIDTSGSMREQATVASGAIGAATKLDLVMDAMQAILNSTATALQPDDRLALVSFDDEPRVNTPFLPTDRRARLLAAINSLTQYSGTTHMGAGLREALALLATETGSKRIILLTDGETMDEELVQEMGKELRDRHIPVTAIGVGDFNESVLMSLADRTQGRVLDIVPDHALPEPPSIPASQLPEAILDEMEEASREVVTDMVLTIQTVKGVEVNRITRVAPQQVEVDLAHRPFIMGNAASGGNSVYIVECTVPNRAPSRMRLAQMGLTYQVPGADYKGETKPMDIILEYTTDASRFQSIHGDVMQWVQQRNVEGMIKRAVQEAVANPEAAAKTLRVAQNFTQKLGNSVMTKVLDRALDELQTNKTISLGTAKTMKMGSKTQTLKANEVEAALPPADEIRKLTGA